MFMNVNEIKFLFAVERTCIIPLWARGTGISISLRYEVTKVHPIDPKVTFSLVQSGAIWSRNNCSNLELFYFSHDICNG